MRLSPPTKIVFLIALVLAILSIPAIHGAIPFVKTISNLFLAWAAYVLLAVATLVKGL